MKRNYSLKNFGKRIKLSGLAALVAGTMALTGCEGGSDGGSDSENVYRVYNGASSYTETDAAIETLNLVQGDGINDGAGYRDFISAQEAQNYLNSINRGSTSSTSDSTDDSSSTPSGDTGSSTPAPPSGGTGL